jgi:hypothetical protein
MKRFRYFRFNETISRREVLTSIRHPYYYKQNEAEPVNFKGTVNEQDLVSYKALTVSNLGIRDEEDLL